ncbi:MAG: hypothetical protein Q7U16_13705 [Agitococcus sp.]|nr:hypothetical protein [Agitococcus sp.]
MRYEIKHGCIASLIRCNGVSFVYPSAELPPGNLTSGDAPWFALPLEVRKVIQEQFDAVYRLPYEEITAYLETLTPIVLDIPDEIS